MGFRILGHFWGLWSLTGGLLQILAACYFADYFLKENGRLRTFTRLATFALAGSCFALLVYMLSDWQTRSATMSWLVLFAGAISGLAGGIVPRWIRRAAAARRDLPALRQDLLTLKQRHTQLHGKEQQCADALTRLKRELREARAALAAHKALPLPTRSGRAVERHEHEGMKQQLRVNELHDIEKRLAARLRTAKRDQQHGWDEMFRCYTRYEEAQAVVARLDDLPSLRQYGFLLLRSLPAYLLVGLILGWLFGHSLPVMLSFAFTFGLFGFFDVRLVRILYVSIGTFAEELDDAHSPPWWFSWKGFLVAGVPMFLIELWVWFTMQPDLAKDARLALFFGVGAGVAGGLSSKVEDTIQRLRPVGFGKIGLALLLVGLICQFLQN